MKAGRHSAAILFFGLLVTGCGGGGGGGGGGSGSGGGNTGGSAPASGSPDTWEFYQGSLKAVSPGALSSPVTVESGAVSVAAPVNGGDFSSGTLANETVARVVYARTSDDTLWQVATNLNVAPPSPQRMSSQSGTPVCTFRIGQDLDNPDNARILAQLDTGGNDCGSGATWKIMRLGDGATVAPGTFPGQPIVGVIDPVNGSHAGWLSLDGGVIKRVTYSSGVVTSTAVSNSPGGIASAGYFESLLDGTVLLNLDGAIHAYDSSANSLTRVDSGFTVSGLNPLYVADGDELFLVDNNTLYRADPGAGTVTVMDDSTNAAFAMGTQRLTVTPGHVVWSYGQDTNNDMIADTTIIRSVDKATGQAFELDRGSLAFSSNQGIFDRSGGWFFYTRVVGGAPQAIARKADGSAVRSYDNAQWIGASINLGSYQDLGSSVEIAYLVKGLNSTGGSYAGKSVQSVAGENPASTPLNLGTLPSDIQSLSLLGGFGANRLGWAGTTSGGQDIFFVDGDRAGSLTRLTDTPGTNEMPVIFF